MRARGSRGGQDRCPGLKKTGVSLKPCRRETDLDFSPAPRVRFLFRHEGALACVKKIMFDKSRSGTYRGILRIGAESDEHRERPVRCA